MVPDRTRQNKMENHEKGLRKAVDNRECLRKKKVYRVEEKKGSKKQKEN